MKVSIVIPCYNEKDTMKKIVEAVPNTPLTYREIIVVDDCSEDRTQTLLRDKLSHVIDRVIYHSVNRGTSPLLHRCGRVRFMVTIFGRSPLNPWYGSLSKRTASILCS